jgi:hypothetical protein
MKATAKEAPMTPHDDDSHEPTWSERLRRLDREREPLVRRIGAAHEEGDYETRDRLWRELEARRESGMR